MTSFNNKIGGGLIKPLKTDLKESMYKSLILTKVEEVSSSYII
jgi:hypothetical protein